MNNQSGKGDDGCIALAIEPREKDLGDFTVRRALPTSKRRMVGPAFIHYPAAELPDLDIAGVAVRVIIGDDEFISLP